MFRLLLAIQSCFAFAPVDPPDRLDRLDRLAKEVFSYNADQVRKAAPPPSAVPDPLAFVMREPGKTYFYHSTSVLVRSGTVEFAEDFENAVDWVGDFNGAERVTQTADWYFGVMKGRVFLRAKSEVNSAWTLHYPSPNHGLKFQTQNASNGESDEKIWWYLGDFTDSKGKFYQDTFALFIKGRTFTRVLVFVAGRGCVYMRHYGPALQSDPVRKQEHFLMRVEPTTCPETVKAQDKP